MMRMLFFGLIVTFSTAFCFEIEFTFEDIDGGGVIASAMIKSANKAFALNMKGLDALEGGDLDGALALFRQAADKLDNYVDARNNIGVVYFRKGDAATARKIWRELIENDKRYALAYFNLGVADFAEKRNDAAQENFLKSIKYNNKFTDGYIYLGKLALSGENTEAAIGWLRKAYKVDAKHPGAWGFLAYALIERGDTAAAQSLLEQHRDHAGALEILGTIEANRKMFKKAAGTFLSALARGGDPALLVKLASVQVEEDDCLGARATMISYFAKVPQPSADAYQAAGVAAQACNDIAEAKRYFEEGIRRFPEDEILRYNAGKIYYYEKEYTRAENMWSGLSHAVNDPELLYLRALNAYKLNRHEEADALVRKAIRIDRQARFYDLKGIISYAQNNKEEAERLFKQALDIDPNLRSAQINLSLVDTAYHNLDDAVAQVWREQRACKKECGKVAMKLAMLLYRQNLTGEAADVLARVPAQDKTEKTYRTQAHFYREIQNYEKAISALEQAGQHLALSVEARQEQAQILLTAGKYVQAERVLLELVADWVENPWRLYYQIGYARMERHDYAGAQEYFEKSIARKQDNPASKSLLAFVLQKLGDSGKARSLWAGSLQDDPDNPVLLVNLGLAHEDAGEFDKALEYYTKALQANPGKKEIYINIGNAQRGLENYRKSIDAYEKALSSPKKSEAAFNLFLSAREMNDLQRAEKMAALLEREDPSSDYAVRAGGEFAVWRGDTADGIRMLEKVKHPEDDDYLRLAELYAWLGDDARVREYIDKLPDQGEYASRKAGIAGRLAFVSKDFGRAFSLWNTSGDSSFDARFNLALAALHARRFEQAHDIAVSLYAQAEGADKVVLAKLVAQAASATYKWDVARQWYAKLLPHAGDDHLIWFNLAVAEYNLGEIDSCWSHYRKAQALNPDLHNEDIENRYHASNTPADTTITLSLSEIEQLYNRAVALQSDGRTKEAEELYRTILNGDHRFVQAWNNLGTLYAAQGELEKAEECYKNSVKRRGDLPEGYANLVNLYLAVDEVQKAQRWIKRALARVPESRVLREMEQRVNAAVAN
ncbi:MAG: tetratricopeptide repeat protein [Chitinivibrionales bacterium]|nr:tetratricopeptide repeat protein [Chitinivibrionales bacterium]